jgi:hypothetical protein
VAEIKSPKSAYSVCVNPSCEVLSCNKPGCSAPSCRDECMPCAESGVTPVLAEQLCRPCDQRMIDDLKNAEFAA